jgi:hypothetical protein
VWINVFVVCMNACVVWNNVCVVWMNVCVDECMWDQCMHGSMYVLCA